MATIAFLRVIEHDGVAALGGGEIKHITLQTAFWNFILRILANPSAEIAQVSSTALVVKVPVAGTLKEVYSFDGLAGDIQLLLEVTLMRLATKPDWTTHAAYDTLVQFAQQDVRDYIHTHEADLKALADKYRHKLASGFIPAMLLDERFKRADRKLSDKLIDQLMSMDNHQLNNLINLVLFDGGSLNDVLSIMQSLD